VGKTCYSNLRAKIAQLVEHSTENAGVVGSIPSLGTFCCLQHASIRLESRLRYVLLFLYWTVDSSFDSNSIVCAIAAFDATAPSLLSA
jgi:hypothetical protein